MARTRKPPTEPGFRIEGTGLFYPLVPTEKWKQGDIKLVCAVTGMEWIDWAKLVERYGLGHPQTRQGFFAVALQREGNRTAEDVAEFIDGLSFRQGIELVFPPAKEGEESPPAPGATED
jgi:hypothetical protein